MCGIAGKVFFHSIPEKSDQSEFDAALGLQNHRGPDYTKSTIQGNCILGHNRLSILDLNSRSHQPMKDSSAKYTICYNGEIYNYQNLKNNLLREGVQFKTSSDTEVVLYHLIKYGSEGFKDFEGCFSIAFYDGVKQELILSRDHKGINPLLYSIDDKNLIFASELQTIVPFLKNKTIDNIALNKYFKYTYIPAPHTMLKEVNKVMPGEIITLIKGKIVRSSIHIENPIEEKETDLSKLKSKLRVTLENAVANRLQADVPIGTFLSGGLDSSIVSAIAANFKEDLHTFSIGFKGNDHFNETSYSKLVAKHIGSIHHPIQLSEEDIAEDLFKVINSFDEPFADSSAIAMYFLSKETKKHVTVALSGDGADELFAGYNKHKAYVKSSANNLFLNTLSGVSKYFPNGSRDSFLSNKARQLEKYNQLRKQGESEKYDYLASFVEKSIRNKLLRHFKEPFENCNEGLNHFLLKDQSFILPNDMLKKVDLMSMQHSLEVRVPFLDQSVINFANSLSEKLKLNGNNGKFILKETFKDLLPVEILKRSKKGFEVPLNQWIMNLWENLIQENWFSQKHLIEQDIFDYETISEIRAQLFSKHQGNSGTIIWAYIVFQNWYDKTFSI